MLDRQTDGQTYRHARTQTDTQTDMTCTHIRTDTGQTDIYTYMHARPHARLYVRMHTHGKDKDSLPDIHTCMHACTSARTHVRKFHSWHFEVLRPFSRSVTENLEFHRVFGRKDMALVICYIVHVFMAVFMADYYLWLQKHGTACYSIETIFWNDIFRIFLITIIFYRLPNYFEKTERMRENKNK